MNDKQNNQIASDQIEWRNANVVLPPVGQLCEVSSSPLPTKSDEESPLEAALVRLPCHGDYAFANGEELNFRVHGVRWWRPLPERST